MTAPPCPKCKDRVDRLGPSYRRWLGPSLPAVPVARPDSPEGDAWVCVLCGLEWAMHPEPADPKTLN
jgi:hypothetical protein